MAYNTKNITKMEAEIDDWTCDFEEWLKSDNVFKQESKTDIGEYVYRTQCTLWRKTFTYEEIKKYYEHEYK